MDIKHKINEFLVDKFLEVKPFDISSFVDDDSYYLGKYDALEEISDFINNLAEFDWIKEWFYRLNKYINTFGGIWMKEVVNHKLAIEIERRLNQGYKFNDFMKAKYTYGYSEPSQLHQISGEKLAKILLNGYVVMD